MLMVINFIIFVGSIYRNFFYKEEFHGVINALVRLQNTNSIKYFLQTKKTKIKIQISGTHNILLLFC